MTNCNYCLHSDVCKIFDTNPCSQFKDKREYIQQPHKIGDVVYILDYEDGEPYDYSGYILLMANADFALLSPAVNGEEDPHDLCNIYFENYVEYGNLCCDSCIVVPMHELLNLDEAKQALEKYK